MIVLGISPLDKDSTVSIVRNGKVLYAAGEERFTRNKLQDGFPAESLEAGLKYTGISPKDIDVVAYPFFNWEKETELFTANLKDEKELLEESEIATDSKEIREGQKSLNAHSLFTALKSQTRRWKRVPSTGFSIALQAPKE
jgi:carbamoyltransferase